MVLSLLSMTVAPTADFARCGQLLELFQGLLHFFDLRGFCINLIDASGYSHFTRANPLVPSVDLTVV